MTETDVTEFVIDPIGLTHRGVAVRTFPGILRPTPALEFPPLLGYRVMSTSRAMISNALGSEPR